MFKTLFFYELKKLVTNKVMAIAFIVLLLAGATMGLNEEGRSSNRQAAKISEDRNVLNGRMLDDALLSELSTKALDEYGLVWNPEDIAYEDAATLVIETVGENIPLSNIDADLFYEKRAEMIDEGMTLAGITDSERSYWEQEEASVQVPFTVDNVNSPVAMANGLSNIALLGLFYTAICLSGVFAGEYRLRTDKLILSSRNGGRKLLLAKISAGLSFSLVSMLVINAAFVAVTISVWGTEGFGAMVQLQCPFAAVSMTQADLIKHILVLLIASTVLSALTALALSELVRNEIAVIGIMIAVNVGSFAAGLFVPNDMRVLSQAVSMAPMTFISPRMLYEFRLIGRSGHYIKAFEFVPMLYLVLSLLLMLVLCRHYLQVKRK